MKMTDGNYDISVLILTYNPSWEKLKNTVVSALVQKNLNFEIIVSDDGSENNYFGKLEELFLVYNFTNYKLLYSEKNEGTVNNLNKALLASKGIYIRAISPGDYLFSEDSLTNWLKYVKQKNIDVCFGLPVYYNDDDELKFIKHKSAPELMYLYRKRNENTIHREYLLMDDNILGAAYLVKKDLILKYNSMMVNKVKLFEDFAYTLMVFEHIPIYMYDKFVVWYEFGNGVSTSKNTKFYEIMHKDWMEMHNIMLTLDSKTKFDKKFKKCILRYNKLADRKFLCRVMRYVVFPEMFLWLILKLIRREFTETDVDLTFFNNIRNS